jgi:hypothetical protein
MYVEMQHKLISIAYSGATVPLRHSEPLWIITCLVQSSIDENTVGQLLSRNRREVSSVLDLQSTLDLSKRWRLAFNSDVIGGNLMASGGQRWQLRSTITCATWWPQVDRQRWQSRLSTTCEYFDDEQMYNGEKVSSNFYHWIIGRMYGISLNKTIAEVGLTYEPCPLNGVLG